MQAWRRLLPHLLLRIGGHLRQRQEQLLLEGQLQVPFLRAFAGAGIGLGALSTDRHTTTMTKTTIAVDGGQTLQRCLLLTTEVTLDDDLLPLNHLGDLDQLVLGKLTSAQVRADSRLLENLGSCVWPNAINIWKRSFDSLLIGNFDAKNTCHIVWTKNSRRAEAVRGAR